MGIWRQNMAFRMCWLFFLLYFIMIEQSLMGIWSQNMAFRICWLFFIIFYNDRAISHGHMEAKHGI